MFLVLQEDVSFEIDGRPFLAGPGTSVFLPRGIPHTFLIQSTSARIRGAITPGEFERLFRNLSIPAERRTLPEPGTVPFDVPAVMAEQERLGTTVVGPPMTLEG